MDTARPILLLTRPRDTSVVFWNALSAEVRGTAECLINPLLTIRVTGPLPSLTNVNGLIVTSRNGVLAYSALGGLHVDIPAFAVGDRTADAARDLGFDVPIVAETADQLVATLSEVGATGPLVHLRGEHSIGNIAQRLTKSGIATSESILYAQDLEPLSSEAREALSQDRPVIAPVFSARTARMLRRESEGMNAMRFAAISPAVAQELPPNTRTARKPDREAMIHLVSEMVAEAQTLEGTRRQL